MATTDTSEKGLETLIVAALTGQTEATVALDGTAIRESSAAYGGAGYVEGDARDFDREYAVDLAKLLEFLRTTQPMFGMGRRRRHVAALDERRSERLCRLVPPLSVRSGHVAWRRRMTDRP